jgi:hypothetical protein
MPYLTSKGRELVVIKVLRDHLSSKRLWIFNDEHFTVLRPIEMKRDIDC